MHSQGTKLAQIGQEQGNWDHGHKKVAVPSWQARHRIAKLPSNFIIIITIQNSTMCKERKKHLFCFIGNTEVYIKLRSQAIK